MSRICWCSLKCSVGGWLSGSPTSPGAAGPWCHCPTAAWVWTGERAPHPGRWWVPSGSAVGLQSKDRSELCGLVPPEQRVPTGSSRWDLAGRQPGRWHWMSSRNTEATVKSVLQTHGQSMIMRKRKRMNRGQQAACQEQPTLEESTRDYIIQHLPSLQC